MSRILVIGSSNTDMVIRVPSIPQPGQTISGGELSTFGGGKGANQAVAACRSGGDVAFIAAIGDDDLGKSAKAAFDQEGIDTDGVQRITDCASGVAFIFVDDAGENSIGVAPGANARLSPELIGQSESLFADASVVLMQLEVPLESIRFAKRLADQNNCKVIINPAPAKALPDEILDGLYCLTPNESEASSLTGIDVNDLASAERAADVLLNKGVANVVVTMGSQGALLKSATDRLHETADAVDVVDTTGAGDTFNGYFAAAIAGGSSLAAALRLAVKAASLSVQSAGAIASIPSREQVLDQH